MVCITIPTGIWPNYTGRSQLLSLDPEETCPQYLFLMLIEHCKTVGNGCRMIGRILTDVFPVRYRTLYYMVLVSDWSVSMTTASKANTSLGCKKGGGTGLG